jgi:DNA-binding MarR family transcriptional regulator
VRTIHRAEHSAENPFLVISSKTVRDSSISFETRGFLAYLLDKPEDWEIRPGVLARETGMGIATVYRLLGRLVDAGYIRRTELKRCKGNGRFESGVIYRIYEVPERIPELQDLPVPY